MPVIFRDLPFYPRRRRWISRQSCSIKARPDHGLGQHLKDAKRNSISPSPSSRPFLTRVTLTTSRSEKIT